ncbi:mucin-binding protein [Leuconostoc pseudomesenteroides]|uniref:mucin-binding protein n=1 Tax=Leuconostoc pseudomesenteroides TaxID=33968 RepID=UPI00166ECC7F|nr:KxYKxGKxW signal peptide domain-containing protein [Leuconostoc pseudomesenteroides]
MSAKYDGRNTRPTNEVKRYKMYKSGRQCITAGLTTLTLAMGFGVAQTTTVSADVALEKSDTVSGDDDKAEVSSSEDDSATSAASESVTVAQAQADLSEANSEVASAQATADAAADDLNQTLDDNEIAAKSLSGTDATAQGATPETANDATVNKDEQDVTDTAHQESDTTSGQVQTGAQPDDVTPKSVNESETSVTSTATTVDAVALSQWQNEAQTAAQEHVDDINEILDQSNTQADADSTDSIERNLAIVALTTHVNQQSSQVKTLTNSATETTDLTAYQELVTKVTSILANMQSEIATAATLVAADKKGVSAAQVKTATVAFDQLVLPDGTVGELSAYGDLVISVAHGSGASFEDAVQAIETQGLTSSFRSIVDPESATYTLVGGDTFTNQTNTTISAGATDFNANSNYVTSTGNGTNAGKQSAYSTTDVLWNLLDDPGSNANATRSFNSALSTVADFTVSGYVTIYNEEGKVSSVGGYASLINPAASTDFAGLILSEKINPVIKQVQSSATNSTAPTGQTTGGGQSYSAGVNPWKRYLITVSTTTTDVGTVNNTTDVAETSSSKVNSWNKVAVTYTYTAGNGKLVALVTYTDANGSTTTVTATYTVDKNVVKQLYVSLGSEVTSNTKNNSSYGAITSIKGTYVTAPVTVNYTGLPTSIASSTITNNVVGSEISVNSDNSGFHIEAADNTYTSASFPTVAGYHVASVTNNNGNLVGTDGVTMTVTYAADVQTANVTYNTLNGAGEIVSSTTVTQNGTTGGTFNIATPAKSGYTASATAITGKYDNTNNGISTTDGTSQDYIVTYTPQVQQAFVDYITYGVDGISYTLTQSEVVSGVTGGTFDIETPAKIGYTVDHTAFTGTFDNTENGTNLVDNTPQTLVVTYTPTAITTTYQYQLPDGSTHTLGTSTTAAGETITIPSNIQSALTAVLLPTQKVNGANTADYTENEDGTWSAIYTIGVTARVQLKIATVVLKSDYDGSTVDNSFKTFIGSDGQAYYIVAEAGDGQDVNEGKAYIGDKPNSTLPDIVKNGTDKAATVGLAPYGYVLGQDIYYDTFGNKTVADTYTTQNAIAGADGSYTHYLLIVATPETVTATVKYVDDDLNGEEVATGEISGLTGTVYSVDGDATLNGDTIYDANKYAFSSVDKGSGSLAVTEDGNVPGIITVHLTHKHETGTTSVTQTVSYTGLPSDKALADKTQIVNFTTDEDLVTGVVTYTQETTAAAIMTPTVSGYTPSITSVAGAAVETSTIAPTDIATTVVYTANNQTIKVIYVDDDNSEGEVASSSFTVPSDGLISFTADVPTNYVVVSTDTPENADSDDTVDQIITVHLKHAKEQVTRTTTATVTYAISGGEADAPDPDVLTVTWTADKDLVTGVISDYTPDITTYTVSTLKKVAGYTATQATVTQTFVNSATPENVSVAVTLVADSETPSESTRTVADTTKVDDALAAVDMVVAGSEEDAAAIDEAKAAAEEAKTALEDAAAAAQAAAAASNAANDKLDEVKNYPTSTVEDIESAAQAAAEAKDASEAANAKVEEAQVAADDAAGDLAEAINTAKENNGESTSASVVTSTSVSVSESRSTSTSVSLADSTSQSDSVSAVASKSSSTKLSDSVSSATSESVSAVASESSSTKLSESVSSATSESNSAVASESSSTKLSESVSSATSESVSAVASESASAKLSESISSATSESISAVASESSSTKLSESTSSATSESVSAVASESASAKLSESTSSATSESVSAVTSESSSTKLSESTSSATSESVSAVASESSSTKLSESTSSATSESVSAVASESASAKLSESTSNATSESVSAVASETSSTKLSGSVSSATSESVSAMASESTSAKLSESTSSSTSESVSAVASESTSAKLSESVSSATSESVSDSRSMSTSVSLADSTSRSDSVSDSRSTSTSVSLADSTSQSNSVSDSRSMSTSVSLTDSTTKSESVSNSDSISKSESISNSDSTSKSDSISNSDSTSKSDSISNSDSTSKSDSISNSESTSKSDSISNSDSTLKSESVSNNDSTSKSESVSNSDSTSKSESISNSDSTLKSESVSNSDSTSKSESVSNSDSTSKSESISNSDSMSKSESISNSESTSKSESISNSESTSKSESISNSDSTSKSESTSESAVTSTSVSESDSKLASDSVSDSRSTSSSVSLADSTSQSDSVSDGRSTSTSLSLRDSTANSESTSTVASDLASNSVSLSTKNSTSTTITSENVSTSEYSELNSTKSSESLSTSSSQANESQSLSTIASDEISTSLSERISASDSLSTAESTSAVIVSEHNATSVKLSDATSLSESTAIVNQSDSTSVRVMPSDEISTSESKSQSVSEFTSEFDSTLTSLHRSEVSSERQSKSQVDDTTGNIVMKNQATDRVQTLESTTGSNMTAKLTTTAPTISAEKVTSTNSLSVPSQATVLKGLLPENPKIITARRILIGQYETGDKFNIRLILEILTPLILILGFLLAAKRRKKEDDAETK